MTFDILKHQHQSLFDDAIHMHIIILIIIISLTDFALYYVVQCPHQ